MEKENGFEARTVSGSAAPAFTTVPVSASEPAWMPATILAPAEATPTPNVTLIRTPVRLGDDTVLELERAVRDTCRTSVTVTELVATVPGRLTIRFIAPNESVLAEAEREIAQMPQLKSFVVDFDAKVVNR